MLSRHTAPSFSQHLGCVPVLGFRNRQPRSEATARKLKIPFQIADMRNLGEVPGSPFDAVICMDNALPHLRSELDLTQAAGQIRANLRGRGTFVASMRDYDEILAHHLVMQAPAFYSDEGKRRIVFQI